MISLNVDFARFLARENGGVTFVIGSRSPIGYIVSESHRR
jgi:hypothetical protein